MIAPKVWRRGAAFTLVEMMVSISLVLILALLLVSMTNQTSALWSYTTSRIEQFREAGDAFQSMSNRLSQATLNTYWDYDSNTAPTTYLRKSDLRFLSGHASKIAVPTDGTVVRRSDAIFFVAPLGFTDDPANFGDMPNLLNVWGYYVEFNKDTRPNFLLPSATNGQFSPPPLRYRYRLMELMQPTNALNIFTVTALTSRDWYAKALNSTDKTPPLHVLAENVVALCLIPKRSTADTSTTSGGATNTGLLVADDYLYDSTVAGSLGSDASTKNQLPPLVQITMVAIDEASASRTVRAGSTESPKDHLPSFDKALTDFSSPAQFDVQLQALQAALVAAHVSFRVFTTNVSIRGAKWSTN